MKSIVIVINDITQVGGTERAATSLANILQGLGHKVAVLNIVSPAKKSSFALDIGVVRDALAMDCIPTPIIAKIRWNISFIKNLRRYLVKNETDIIIGTGHNINWLLPLIGKAVKLDGKIVACEHIVYESLPIISRLLMSLTYGKLDKLVVLSQTAQKSYRKYKNVTIIPNPLPFLPDEISPLTSKQILIVGRISEVKGLERLVDIIKELIKNDVFDWKIRIVGQGEAKDDLIRLYQAHNIEQYIEFASFTQDVKMEYYNSSLYIMTSHFEAFPMVLLEAKSMGLPVVAFDCPEGPREIIVEGVDGFLIKNGDCEMFARAIERIIYDKNLRSQMGQKAQEDSIKYLAKSISLKWEILINED